jgi:hypothetical protein
MVAEADIWKRCSTCKSPIAFASTYYQCSVSTCTRKRSGFVFCKVDCWEAHVPMMRHREAWAVEETAPTKAQWAAEQAAEGGESKPKAEPARAAAPAPAPAPAVVRRPGGEGEGRRITVPSAAASPPPPKEVLVIASRLKDYIRTRYGMNTSDGVLEPLSDALRRLADRAVMNARDDGRKTLLDRDFAFLDEEK